MVGLFTKELNVGMTNWWSNDQFVILNWELVFLDLGNPQSPIQTHQFVILLPIGDFDFKFSNTRELKVEITNWW